ncbi:MAG TPA: hypothetical protein VMD76_05130, partial [Candidatus Sulfotelmatobacter sp.]|nr:hypothetical protein [Candidatus Sulfotelmatobacter sp.]
MKFALPIFLVAATAALIVAGLYQTPAAAGTVGIAAGSSLFAPRPDTPDHALIIFLDDMQRRNWRKAFADVAQINGVDEQAMMEDWNGSHGSLRTFSSLENFQLWPLHASSDEASIRTRLHWSTPVGPVEEVRDFHLVRDGNIWQVVWPKIQLPATPAQVVPVTYLRWDLVTGGAQDSWGSHNVDAPRVRITSMNAVDSPEGVVIVGEVVNEDTVPAFVNVNAALIDANGKTIDEESSFDRIAHVLLPKEVSPYRIDFPGILLADVKNVHMDVRPALVPASADPVIGVVDQKIEEDAQGNSVLQGKLQNQSGRTVNIPHVIASFYDNDGRVVWVSDGYVDRALLPLGSEPF